MKLHKHLWICIFTAVVLLCLFALPQRTSAASVSDLTFMFNSNRDSCLVYSCNETAKGEIVIPATYKGFPVTGIADSAFSDCSNLTSIIIPDSVISIGWDAFTGCAKLTSIIIPDSVTSIAGRVFGKCTSLTELQVAERNPMYHSAGNCIIETDSKTLLVGCKTSRIPDDGSVTSIGDSAFSDCTGLTSITIPDGVASIGSYAFEGCSGLNSITLPNGIASINDYVFSGCTNLTSIAIPNSVISIREGAFNKCNNLTSVAIPDSVISIGYQAFYDCNNLIVITIPNNVTSIGGKAFYNCNHLTSITIGNNVVSVGGDAFYGCTRLEEINFNATSMLDLSSGNYVFYNAGQVGDGITVNIGANVTHIPAYLFSPYSSYALKITTVTFAENSVCESIGNYAFRNCTSLTSVTIPDSVTNIGGDAFYGCTSLTSIAIPNNVTVISDYAFYGCTGLTGIAVPDSATSIGSYAFYGCSGLVSVTIGNSVTSIGDYAFSFCDKLTTISLSESVTSIGCYAFGECTSLASVTIPNNVTNIGDSAFCGCTGLTSITIPDGVTSIGKYAFYNCTGIEEINFNATAMADLSSKNYVFYNAGKNGNGITANIGADVTRIPAYLFYPYSSSYYAPKITTVTFAVNSVCESIGTGAFNYCNSLNKVIYCGTTADWDSISVGSNNTKLLNAARQYHNYSTVVTEPTCTTDGLSVKTCTLCGTVTQEVISALGHSYENGVCTGCGEKQSVPGEIDGNEGVTYNDAIYLLLHTMFGENAYPLNGANADIDGNGMVDQEDAVYLLLHTMFGEAFYPLKRS